MSSTKSARRAELECKREREKGFILDGTVVSRLANDETDRNAPSLNFGIPQYNALTDPHCKSYFKSKAVPKKFKTAIRNPETPSPEKSTMQGSLKDEWLAHSQAIDYLQKRRSYGAGYCSDMFAGHLSTPPPKGIIGYHGEAGYRRNTFDLRRRPSVFGDGEEDGSRLPPLKPTTRQRTMSAPPKMQSHRIRSARVYSAKVHVPQPRAQSAIVRRTSNVTRGSRLLPLESCLPEEQGGDAGDSKEQDAKEIEEESLTKES